MNQQNDTERIPVIYGETGELLTRGQKLLLLCAVLLFFVIYFLVFAPIQTHTQVSSSGVSEERTTLYLPQSVLDHNSKFVNDLEQDDPRSFLHPQPHYGFSTDLFDPDRGLTQSAVSIDFITDANSHELTEIPSPSFSTSSIRLLNTVQLILEAPSVSYPVFSSDAGVLEIQELALSSLDKRHLNREPPEAPTVLRVTAIQNGLPLNVEVARSCGVIRFDMIARNHLETQINTDAFPKNFKKDGQIIRVLWSPGKFGNSLISEQDRRLFQ